MTYSCSKGHQIVSLLLVNQVTYIKVFHCFYTAENQAISKCFRVSIQLMSSHLHSESDSYYNFLKAAQAEMWIWIDKIDNIKYLTLNAQSTMDVFSGWIWRPWNCNRSSHRSFSSLQEYRERVQPAPRRLPNPHRLLQISQRGKTILTLNKSLTWKLELAFKMSVKKK